jgi:hypothetical protein
MKKQTAVEYLFEQYFGVKWDSMPNKRPTIFEEAKEMEKEQIIKARQDGLDNGFSNGSWDSNLYYKETYGNK